MALLRFVAGLENAVRDAERRFVCAIFGRPPSPPGLDFALNADADLGATKGAPAFSLKDLIGDGFLYAAPKHRKSIEKRINQKFGWPGYFWKPLVPKTNLRVCNDCGHHHEVGKLCANCYEKVRIETQEMQDKIKEELKLDPVDSEVVVLYDGEKLEQPAEFWKGRRIVEMKKPRPPWFSKNLMERTTQQPSASTDVKPTELA